MRSAVVVLPEHRGPVITDVYIVLITLPPPSEDGFYSCHKVGDSGYCLSSQWADGRATGRDVKQFLGGPVRFALSAAGRGHLYQCWTGGLPQV